jgi:hypothetical protein
MALPMIRSDRRPSPASNNVPREAISPGAELSADSKEFAYGAAEDGRAVCVAQA